MGQAPLIKCHVQQISARKANAKLIPYGYDETCFDLFSIFNLPPTLWEMNHANQMTINFRTAFGYMPSFHMPHPKVLRIRKFSEVFGSRGALHHVDQEIRRGADKPERRYACNSPENDYVLAH